MTQPTTLPTYSLKESVRYIAVNLLTQLLTGERMPVSLESAPGTGKSSVVHKALPMAICEVLNNLTPEYQRLVIKAVESSGASMPEVWEPKHIHINTLMAPTQEGVIAQGLPVPMRTTPTDGSSPEAYTIIARSRLSRPVTDAVITVSFIDELDKGAPDLVNALSEFINSGLIGDTQMPITNFCVTARNRAVDRSGSRALPMHIQNRLDCLNVDVPVQDYVEYVRLNTNLSTTAIGFVLYDPAVFVDAVPATPEPYCTRRSYTKCMEGLAIAESLDALTPEQKNVRLTAAIGSSAATKYMAYSKFEAMCTPYKDIIADPEGAPVPTGLGVQWAQSMSLWNNCTDADSPAVFKYMLRMPKQFWATLLEHKLMDCPSLFADPMYITWVNQDENLEFLTRVAAYQQ